MVTSYRQQTAKMTIPDLPVTFQELKVNFDGPFPLCESKSHSLWFKPQNRSSSHSSLINSSMSFSHCSSSGSKAKRLILSSASYSRGPTETLYAFVGEEVVPILYSELSKIMSGRSLCLNWLLNCNCTSGIMFTERSGWVIGTEFRQMLIFGR